MAVGAMRRTTNVEYDLTEKRPRPVRTRFELAVGRMMDAWIAAGRLRVSTRDVKLAREFLEEAGYRVEETTDARVRIVTQEGRTQEMTREAAVVAALRRLAAGR
jgi:hypothetical protein